MITGAHSILYSRNAEADRDFLRDVLRFPHVDAGGGWLIFGLPPSEVAVHPGEENDVLGEMASQGVACGEVHDPPWGRLTEVALPGGGRLGVDQPRHARPEPA